MLMRVISVLVISGLLGALAWCGRGADHDLWKHRVREIYETGFSNGDFSSIDKYYSSNFVAHSPGMEDLEGPEAFRKYLKDGRKAFPDATFMIEEVAVDDGGLAFRWRYQGTQKGAFEGIPATGKKVDMACMSFYRIENDKLVEKHWICDTMGMMQQLGVVPAE